MKPKLITAAEAIALSKRPPTDQLFEQLVAFNIYTIYKQSKPRAYKRIILPDETIRDRNDELQERLEQCSEVVESVQRESSGLLGIVVKGITNPESIEVGKRTAYLNRRITMAIDHKDFIDLTEKDRHLAIEYNTMLKSAGYHTLQLTGCLRCSWLAAVDSSTNKNQSKP